MYLKKIESNTCFQILAVSHKMAKEKNGKSSVDRKKKLV
jgi:hypothetical protein